MNRSLDFVLADERIATVVFSLRSSLYLRATDTNLVVDGLPASRPNSELFRIALERTVARIVESGKSVVYALDWPELDFDPKRCVDIRPLRFHRFDPGPCSVPRRKVDARDAAYRAMVLAALAKFPRTYYWDPKKVLCDDQSCWAMKDGVMLYRDDNHLSLVGSEYLGKRFALEEPAR
jgi:hypothetical protein